MLFVFRDPIVISIRLLRHSLSMSGIEGDLVQLRYARLEYAIVDEHTYGEEERETKRRCGGEKLLSKYRTHLRMKKRVTTHFDSPVRLEDEVRVEASVVSILRELRQGRVKRVAVYVHRVVPERAHIGASEQNYGTQAES